METRLIAVTGGTRATEGDKEKKVKVFFRLGALLDIYHTAGAVRLDWCIKKGSASS